VPAVLQDLDISLARQARTTVSGSSSGSGIDPLPYGPTASAAAAILRGTLAAWTRALISLGASLTGPTCRHCQHDSCRRIVPVQPATDHAVSMARWLRRNQLLLLQLPDGVTAVDEIRYAVAEARRVVDRPGDLIYAGPCLACGTDLYARPGAAVVRCRCSTPDNPVRYFVADRRAWMLDAVSDRLATAAEIARALSTLMYPIAPELIRTWAIRGKLAPVPTPIGPVCGSVCQHESCSGVREGRGRPRFRIGDVVTLMQRSARWRSA